MSPLQPRLAHPGFSVPSHPFHLAFHPEEQLLAVSTVSGHIYFAPFDLENSDEPVSLHKFKPHSLSARVVEFSRSSTFLSAGADGKVVLSDLNPKKIWQSASEEVVPINCAVFLDSASSALILAGDDNGLVSLFDTRAGKAPVQLFSEQSDYITSILPFSRTSLTTTLTTTLNTTSSTGGTGGTGGTSGTQKFVVTSADATLAVFDARKPKSPLIALSDAQDDELCCSAFLSATTSRTVAGMTGAVITGDTRGVIGVWKKDCYGDVRDRVTVLEDQGSVEHMVSISDGRVIVAGGGGLVRCIQLYPHVEEGIVGMHENDVEGIAIDEDLGVMASADSEGQVKLWKLPGKVSKVSKDAGKGMGKGTGVARMDKKTLETQMFFDDLE